ncbi:MAG: autotransporter domain-containing protein [Elusimicrobiota bacterium]|jgi:autotransporter-associated beta strand protein/predicted outer membrane repeat protein|nr:autotransporter domain-containing protein [Elusimicrobiota bacterium]
MKKAAFCLLILSALKIGVLYADTMYISGEQLNIGEENANINFSNYNAQRGAVIYAANGASIIFKDANFEFSYNNSTNSDGIIELADDSKLKFENIKTLKAQSNQANNGGFLFLTNNPIYLSGYSLLINNKARSGSGGAIYMSSSSLFIASATFKGNSANLYGGALYLTNTQTTIESAQFINNIAKKGAAVYANNSPLIFRGRDFEFSGNNSDSNGIIELEGNSSIKFDNIKTLKAENNKANNGGFLFLSNTPLYLSGYSLIMNNTARSGSGGAIYMSSSSLFITSAVFNANFASVDGGALYLKNAKTTIEDCEFKNNRAGNLGGAIYIDASDIEINAKTKDAIFIGNYNNGKDNDIYMKTSVKLSLFADKNQNIKLYGGIKGDESNRIVKNGEGTLILSGATDFKGKFTIESGKVSINQNEIIIGNLFIAHRVVYGGEKSDMSVYKTYAGDIEIYGTINLAVDFTRNTSDMLIASSAIAIGAKGTIIIGTSSIINIDAARIDAIGNARISILEAREITGRFNINSSNGNNMDYILQYEPDRVDLIIRRWSDFAYMDGLTQNQKQMGVLIDDISKDYQTIPDDMRNIISHIYSMPENLRKEYLSKLSGEFFANIISDALNGDGNQIIYSRLNPKILLEESKRVWFKTYGFTGKYDKSDICSAPLSINGYSIAGGADIIKNETLIFGAYLQYGGKTLSQTSNKTQALLNDYEIGLYAMNKYILSLNDIFLKANMSFGFQDYFTSRKDIELFDGSHETESAFKTRTLKGAAQIQYAYNKNLSFFTGVNSVFLTNPDIKEKNGGLINLKIDSENHLRISALIGIDIENKQKKLDWNVKLYAKQVLYGCQSEIKTSLSNFDIGEKAEISSVKEGLSGGIFGEIEYPLSNSISLFLSNDINVGETRYYISLNLGINYKIPLQKDLTLAKFKTKFHQAQEMADNKLYFKAVDLLSEILSEKPDFTQASRLDKKIKLDMQDNLNSLNIKDFVYAKALILYDNMDYDGALSELYRYIQLDSDNEEVALYYNKLSDLLETDESSSLTENAGKKADAILKIAIGKFNKQLWTECIKDMEKLKVFVKKANPPHSYEYNKKAQEYIEACVKQLEAGISQTNETYNETEIDEKGADEKYDEGLLFYSQGKYIEAQRAWELVLRINPKHKRAKISLENLEKSGHIIK